MTRDEAIAKIEEEMSGRTNPYYEGWWPWERTLLLLQVGVPIFEVRQKVVDGHYTERDNPKLREEWLAVAKIVGRVREE